MAEEQAPDLNRRKFLAISASGIVGLAVGYIAGRATAPVEKVVETRTITEPVEKVVTKTETKVVEVEKKYERVKIANIRDLQEGKPLNATYMNKQIVVLKLGEPAVGGVGPDKDIVAFSTFCTHMGGALVYDEKNRR